MVNVMRSAIITRAIMMAAIVRPVYGLFMWCILHVHIHVCRPFINCTYASFCSRAHRNGVCDPVCATEDCLFDGFDCQPSRPLCDVMCTGRAGDGHCDVNCNTTACAFDGGDCATTGERSLRMPLIGDVVLIVLASPEEFARAWQRFVITLSNVCCVPDLFEFIARTFVVATFDCHNQIGRSKVTDGLRMGLYQRHW
jgi:hypothetical protein